MTMRKRHFGVVLLAVFGLVVLGACMAAPQSEHEENVVAGGYDKEVCVKKVDVGKHEYYVVYASCDGHHSVRTCGTNHCFLRHSPDCPCRKVQSAVDAIITDDGESTDPFNW